MNITEIFQPVTSLLTILFLFAILLWSPYLFAAADSELMAIEEIVVTSRKREENLQEVPEAITAFSSRQLELAKVESLRDFVDLTPNLMIRETFRSNESFLTLRGLSSAQGGLPPVSFVVDGVQLGSNDFINQDLLDVERIEVLKGPQGALYGQGAIAGAIVVTTRAPGNEPEFYIKGSYGKGDSYRVAASGSTPIIKDTLYLRVSGYYRDSDGLIDNVRGEDIDFSEEGSIRMRLQYEGDDLRASLRGSYTEGDGNCCQQDRLPRDSNRQRILPDVDIDNVDFPGPSSDIIGTSDTSFRDVSLKLDYDLENFTLTSITGYAEVRQSVFGDADFAPVPFVKQDLAFNTDVFNQEVRLASDSDNRLQWLVGGFYQDRQERQPVFVGAVTPGAGLPVPDVILDLDNEINSESWAVFGQLSYDITDKLEGLFALRYDEDDQDTVDKNNPASYKKASFDELQPKAQLSYRWTDDILTFFTYSTGFRTGGFTQNTQFDNEKTDNFELGFKGTFLDRRLIVNASVFHVDYANQQLSFVVFDNNVAQRGVVNIPSTDIDGLELELQALPLDGLNLSFGVGITDSVVKEIDALDSALGDVSSTSGNRSPFVPSFTFNGSLTYTYQLYDEMDLVLHTDYRRRGNYYYDLNNDVQSATRDFIDGRIALEARDWSLALWGRNLTDSRHATRVAVTGSALRNQNQPRSYGVEFSFRF